MGSMLLLISSSLSLFPGFWWPFQENQLQSISSSPLFSAAFSLAFIFLLVSLEQQGNASDVLFFVVINTRSSLRWRIEWSICISKLRRIFDVSFPWTDFWFVHKTFVSMSCLVLYFFCAYLLYFLLRCSTVSSLSQHNLPLLFFCVFQP